MHLRTRISSDFQQGALKQHVLMMSVMKMFKVLCASHELSPEQSWEVVRAPKFLGDSESGLKSGKLEELEKLFTNTYISQPLAAPNPPRAPRRLGGST